MQGNRQSGARFAFEWNIITLTETYVLEWRNTAEHTRAILLQPSTKRKQRKKSREKLICIVQQQKKDGEKDAQKSWKVQ